MTISTDCRVGTKVPPRNDNKNIAFGGLQEDIEFSRQIVRGFSKEFGRPHSDTYVTARMMQHDGDSRYAEIFKKLEIIRDKYYNEVKNSRTDFFAWLDRQNLDFLNLSEYIQKTKELQLNKKNGNCGENNEIIQYEHLKRGIKTHTIQLRILDKHIGRDIRDHIFSLRNLPKNADIRNPRTWGNAILIDAWSGGIVEKAVGLREKNKQDGLTQVLDFLCFNPEEEKVVFCKDDHSLVDRFIDEMRAEKHEKRIAQTKKWKYPKSSCKS